MVDETTPTNNTNNINAEELTKTFVAIADKSQQILKTFLKHQHEKTDVTMAHLAHMGKTYQEFIHKFLANPAKVAEAQFSYWTDFIGLWHDSVERWLGIDPKTEKEEKIDKRFLDDAWKNHPFFNFVKEFYLLSARHIQSIVNDVDGLDKKTAKQVDFYTRQFIDAVSPSNFIVTNPEVLRRTVKTGGKNLLKGLGNMLSDLERSENHLAIKMTDLEAFKLGKNIAITPGKVVYQNDLMQLIQYAPQTKEVYQRPLLMIPPWINKYYILDLGPENSFVKWIVEQGYTVFIISWVNPNTTHAHKDFEDYMLEGPVAALDVIEKITGENSINVLGFCLGGTLLASTLSYLTAKKDKRIKSGTYLATLLDFSEPGDMGALIDEDQIRLLEHEMLKKGYLDGGNMSMTFNMLRANDLIWSYFIKNYLQGEKPFPFDLLYWNSDPTNMPAKMHSFYLRGMYLHNLLAKPNAISLRDIPIDLTTIKVPVYFLSTHFDHIAPWKTTYAGVSLHSGPVTFVLGGSGHIAGVINPPGLKKYNYYVNEKLEADPEVWLKNATEMPGSWWPNWEAWLRKQSGKKIPARKIGKNALEDAPGSYVKVSLLKVKDTERGQVLTN